MKPSKLSVLFLSVLFASLIASATDFKWALRGVNGSEFHNGLSVTTRIDDNYNYLYGVINTAGETAIPFKFKNISYTGFTGGYCEAETDEGIGIIDSNGNFVFGPSKEYDISRESDHPEIFMIKNKSNEKYALFRMGVMLTEFECDYILMNNYPFISLTRKGENNSKIESAFNTLTGDFLDGWKVLNFGNAFVLSKDNKYLYYSKSGERIPISDISKSTKGVEVFIDSKSGKYGLRRGDDIIQPAKYKPGYCGPAWYKDCIILGDSISPDIKKSYTLFNADGEIIYSDSSVNTSFFISESCLLLTKYIGSYNTGNQSVLDFNGNEIDALRNLDLYEIAKGWLYIFNTPDGDKLYSMKSGKVYPAKHALVSGNIIRYDDGKNKYILNPTNEKLYGPYSLLGEYNDGLVKVEKGGHKYFVSENGKEFSIPDKWSVGEFSEGVCKITDENMVHGYIYNPLGYGNYRYNQKSVDSDKNTIMSLSNSAEDAFKNKEYGKAKDICFTIIMADPMNINALNNYAASIYNLGYYEEALSAIQKSLLLDAENEYALSLQKAALSKISQNASTQDENEYEEVSSSISIWEALGRFGEVLEQSLNRSGNGGTRQIHNTNTALSNTSTSLISNSNNSTSSSSLDYKSQYQNWERIAERHYNSITNMGSVSHSKYTHMKRSFREAQKEMARIRREAAKNGINIPQSRWETHNI